MEGAEAEMEFEGYCGVTTSRLNASPSWVIINFMSLSRQDSKQSPVSGALEGRGEALIGSGFGLGGVNRLRTHILAITSEYHRHDSQCQEHRERLNPTDGFPEVGPEGLHLQHLQTMLRGLEVQVC